MAEQQKIVIDIDLKFDDYRRAYYWSQKSVFTFISIVFILAILGTGFIAFREADVIAVILFALAVVFFVLYVFFIFLSIKRRSKELAQIGEKTVIIFDEKGVESISESTVVGTTWDRFAKICETPTDFIFYPQKNIFYPIPKHYFQDNLQIEGFRNLVREKLGEKAKLVK
jgi:hypothetical protein